MSKAKTMASLQKYRRASQHSRLRKRYLDVFGPMMVYRTTKTENPRLSRRMVERILVGKK